MLMTALADRRAGMGLKLGGFMLLRDTGEDTAEEEMFSADEQPDFEEASQEAPDVDMTYFQDSFLVMSTETVPFCV